MLKAIDNNRTKESGDKNSMSQVDVGSELKMHAFPRTNLLVVASTIFKTLAWADNRLKETRSSQNST